MCKKMRTLNKNDDFLKINMAKLIECVKLQLVSWLNKKMNKNVIYGYKPYKEGPWKVIL